MSLLPSFDCLLEFELPSYTPLNDFLSGSFGRKGRKIQIKSVKLLYFRLLSGPLCTNYLRLYISPVEKVFRILVERILTLSYLYCLNQENGSFLESLGPS